MQLAGSGGGAKSGAQPLLARLVSYLLTRTVPCGTKLARDSATVRYEASYSHSVLREYAGTSCRARLCDRGVQCHGNP
eukprot:3114717-Rhodomonas_salina.3